MIGSRDGRRCTGKGAGRNRGIKACHGLTKKRQQSRRVGVCLSSSLRNYDYTVPDNIQLTLTTSAPQVYTPVPQTIPFRKTLANALIILERIPSSYLLPHHPVSINHHPTIPSSHSHNTQPSIPIPNNPFISLHLALSLHVPIPSPSTNIKPYQQPLVHHSSNFNDHKAITCEADVIEAESTLWLVHMSRGRYLYPSRQTQP